MLEKHCEPLLLLFHVFFQVKHNIIVWHYPALKQKLKMSRVMSFIQLILFLLSHKNLVGVSVRHKHLKGINYFLRLKQFSS